MSDKYETELRRFITRSMEHLKSRRTSGMSINIEGKDKDTNKKFWARIRIEINDDKEEEQH